jgi:hypothetical protein
MQLSPPITVLGILIFGLIVTKVYVPQREKTETQVTVSKIAYDQLENWAKRHVDDSGNSLSVPKLIEKMSNDLEGSTNNLGSPSSRNEK